MPGPSLSAGRRKDLFFAAVLVACVLVAGSTVMVPAVTGVFHDDGIYVSTARSLAEGHGYRLIDLPGEPVQTKYPPLYPALLSVIWRIRPDFPDNVRAMQWFTLSLSACSIGLCYYYVVACGYFSRRVAMLAGLLAASSHALLYYSTLLLSEMPFALFLCAALFSLDRYVKTETRSIRHKLLVTLLVALPFLTRSIGVVLMPAAVLFLLVKGRFSRLIASGLAAVLLAWFAWAFHSRQSSPITYYYTSYWGWWKDYMGPVVLARVCFFNLVDAAYSVVYSGCGLVSRLVDVAPRVWPLLAVPAAPAALGLWQGLRRKQLLPWLLLFYLAMVLVWPWPPFRFVIPVLLFLLCYVIDGAGRLLRKLVPRTPKKPLIVGLSCFLFVANVWQTHAVGSFNRATGYPAMSTSGPGPVQWSSFLDAFAWIEANTRPTDVVAAYFDSMVFLYTGRKAFRPLVVTPSPYYGVTESTVTPDRFLRYLRADRGRYVFCTPFDRFGGTSLHRVIEGIETGRPGSVRLVYAGKDRRFAIYRIRGGLGISSR